MLVWVWIPSVHREMGQRSGVRFWIWLDYVEMVKPIWILKDVLRWSEVVFAVTDSSDDDSQHDQKMEEMKSFAAVESGIVQLSG